MIVGLFAWGFALNWFQGGRAQAWQWVKSKWTNQTTGGTGEGTAGPAPAPVYPTPSGNLPPAQQFTVPNNLLNATPPVQAGTSPNGQAA